MKRYITNSKYFILSLMIPVFFAAWYLVFHVTYIDPDALSRSFHSYTIFYGNQPKFANIGFVWPPVPTLAEVPFTLIKPLDFLGFAGNLMSILFLGFTCLFLDKIFKFFNLRSTYRFLLLSLFVLNPMILLYGSNGMSEIIAICFFVATIYYVLYYLKSNNILCIIGASIFTLLAVMTRYEMTALIPTTVLLISVNKISNKKKLNRKDIKGIEKDIILYLTPILFTIAIWIFANWEIMHNPLYFMNSVYSNTSQTGELLSQSSFYRSIANNITSSFIYVLQRVIFLFPAFILFIILPFVKKFRNYTKDELTITLLPLSILLFHMLLLYKGESFGWLRFFIYVIPSAFILAGYLLSYYSNKKFYKAFVVLIFVLCFISGISSLYTMANPSLGKEENVLIKAIITQNTSGLNDYSYTNDLLIANYLKKNIKNKKILTDDATAFPIIYFTNNTHMFIETIDTDFPNALQNVRNDNKISYILVHDHTGLGTTDAINKMYPTMFDNGDHFAILVKDFGSWRLYKKYKS